ncbi:hypothetical protein C8Q78DRAFT_1011714 [Trametes maxima]|nr:hypothetical protein C8Q78DRAFT_1011714 [Trametes maxima]
MIPAQFCLRVPHLFPFIHHHPRLSSKSQRPNGALDATGRSGSSLGLAARQVPRGGWKRSVYSRTGAPQTPVHGGISSYNPARTSSSSVRPHHQSPSQVSYRRKQLISLRKAPKVTRRVGPVGVDTGFQDLSIFSTTTQYASGNTYGSWPCQARLTCNVSRATFLPYRLFSGINSSLVPAFLWDRLFSGIDFSLESTLLWYRLLLFRPSPHYTFKIALDTLVDAVSSPLWGCTSPLPLPCGRLRQHPLRVSGQDNVHLLSSLSTRIFVFLSSSSQRNHITL